jgi:type VII secretion-associated serine protease mycosin
MTLLTTTAALIQKLVAGGLAALLAVAPGLPAQPVHDDIRAQQWHLDFLNIDQVHQISTGKGVIVGVIDSGVDGGHPDLTGRLLPGVDLTFLHRPDALEDLDGHGTAMAGLIAANGQALGIAPDATILPVRRTPAGAGDPRTAADGIYWAVDNGATVLCLAFANPEPDVFLERAIRYALAHDVVVVAGVGNTPDSEGLVYPAAYDGVVGAAAVDRNGNHADFSIVSSAADLAAPAVDIMSLEARNIDPTGYSRGGGTSDATAIIAGVAALIRAKYPELSAEDVIHRMITTADDRGTPGRDNEYGHGIINPLAALTADVPLINPPPTYTWTYSATPPPQPANPRPIILAVLSALFVVLLTSALIVTFRRRPAAGGSWVDLMSDYTTDDDGPATEDRR